MEKISLTTEGQELGDVPTDSTLTSKMEQQEKKLMKIQKLHQSLQQEIQVVRTALNQHISARESLGREFKARESERKRIEMLELQLQEFEDLKKQHSWTVERNLSLEKEKKEHFEQMEFVQKCLDEQVAASQTLEQKLTEKERECKEVEVLKRQLQQFEEVKEQYSWSLKRNESLEKELEQAKELLERNETEHREVCEKTTEMLELQLQEFEDLKKQHSWTVERNLSLEKEKKEHFEQMEFATELQLLQKEVLEENLEEMEFVKKCLEEYVSACKKLEKVKVKESDCKEVEVLKRQLQEFEEVKEQYSWSLKRNESLEEELEQAKQSLARNETERKETCEKLTELQQRQKKVLTKSFEELRSVKQSLEKQVSARKTLEQELREKESECKKIEVLERQLQEFEDMKEEYSWFADRSLSLETEFEQTKQNLVNTELDLKEERRKREIESENWEMETRELERELQLCQSRLKQMGTDRAIQNKPSTCETQTQTVTMQQLDWIETENMEEERHSLEKSLHDKEVEFESERRKLKEELEQAHDKLKQQKISQKTFLQEHLEELRVFNKFLEEEVAVRKSLEKQIETSNQRKTCTCEMQTQTVEQTKLKISEDLDTRETSNDQPLDTRETSEDQPLDTRETSEDQPALKEECRGLQGNLKNLTQLFEEKEEQDMQKQGSCLKRDRVKGKNVAALMKMFEQ
uniref:Uncharacterized protein n=1 Tax=Knipowitschia caucasica TaxID=637954 RepID=A0AAV2K4Z6_KNICA